MSSTELLPSETAVAGCYTYTHIHIHTYTRTYFYTHTYTLVCLESGNCSTGIQQMKKHLFKKSYSILVRTVGVCSPGVRTSYSSFPFPL
jgi:hypothetical protein